MTDDCQYTVRTRKYRQKINMSAIYVKDNVRHEIQAKLMQEVMPILMQMLAVSGDIQPILNASKGALAQE